MISSCGYSKDPNNWSTYETSLRYQETIKNLNSHNYPMARQEMTLVIEKKECTLPKNSLKKQLSVLRLIIMAETYANDGKPFQADSLANCAIAEIKPLSTFYLSESMQNGSVELQIVESSIYLPVSFLLCTMLIALLFYYRKVDSYALALSENTIEIGNLNRRVIDIKEINSNYENEISILNNRIKHLQDTTNEQLGKGLQIYERIKNGGTLKNISIEDEQCFIDYYAFSHAIQFANLTSSYFTLSLRHTTYLILCDMGFDDKTIQQILFVKNSTIRNYRLRMNKNKRQ